MVIKDSGERRTFDTGAVRDMQAGKGRCDLLPMEVASHLLNYLKGGDTVLTRISWFVDTNNTKYLYQALCLFSGKAYDGSLETLLLEVAKHFEDGAIKYGENNWQKGLPVNCYINSAIRHYLKWSRGDKDEPHDRAFVWNLLCCIWEIDCHQSAKEDL